MGATSLFVFVAAAILVIVLISAGKASGVHSASILTVTAPSVNASAAASSSNGESSPASPAGTAGTQTSLDEPPIDLVPYQGANISAEIPAGWTTLENEAQKTGYIESKWSNPADSNDTILIDTSPATSDSLEQDAAPVHEALLRASGYQQLSYGPGNLAGFESWMWTFRISGDQRVDYFFNRCSSGYAVLGSTLPDRFTRLAPTFQDVAQSVKPSDASPSC